MRRLVFLLAGMLMLCAFTGATSWPTSAQMLARGDLEALKGAGLLTLSGSDPGWGTTNAQLATYSDFTTYFANSGSCGGSSNQVISSAAAQACAIAQQTLSIPVPANGGSGSFSPTIISSAGPITVSNGSATCTSTATTTASYSVTIKNPSGTTIFTAAGSDVNASGYTTSGFGSVTTGTTGSWSYSVIYSHSVTGAACSGSITVTYYN